MVLLRLSAEETLPLLSHEVVPWVADETQPLFQSIHNFLNELKILPDGTAISSTEEFLDKFELRLKGSGALLDHNLTPFQLGLRAATTVIARRRQRANAVPTSTTCESPITINSSVQELQSPVSPVAVLPVRDYANLRLHNLFSSFLQSNHLTQASGLFAAERILSLNELCCRTSKQIASILRRSAALSRTSAVDATTEQVGVNSFEAIAFRLISSSHCAMIKHRMVINWEQRLTALYREYNPARIVQVPALLHSFTGDEEDMWMSVREKYEHHVACYDVPQSSSNNNKVTATPRSSDGSRILLQVHEDRVTCPSCSNTFLVSSNSEKEKRNIEEVNAMKLEVIEEKEKTQILLRELQCTIEELSNRTKVAEDRMSHFQTLYEEQKKWVDILEQRSLLKKNVVDGHPRSENGVSSHQKQWLADQPFTWATPPKGSAAPRINLTASPLEALVQVDSSQQQAHHALLKSMANIQPSPSHYDKLALRRKLVQFYAMYAPERVPMVDFVLNEWKGKEQELERLLAIKPSTLHSLPV